MKLTYLLALVALFTYSCGVSAIRCNSKIVEVGDRSFKFFTLCGEPDFVEKKVIYQSVTESNSSTKLAEYFRRNDLAEITASDFPSVPFTNIQGVQYREGNEDGPDYVLTEQANEISRRQTEAFNIEEWTYNFGASRLIQKVTFINGVAIEITSLEYGYNR